MCRFELGRLATLGVITWALNGCYSYATVPPSGATVGERVRVRVSGAQAERLESIVGLTNRSIEGELLEQADSSIALGVALPAPIQGGSVAERTQQRIVIPRADVQDVELRRLDKLRTSLLVGAALAGAVAIAATKGTTLLGGGGSGGNPNESRVPAPIPLVKLRFGIP